MYWTLSDIAMKVDIVEPSSSYRDDQTMAFSTVDEAARFLEHFTSSWGNYAAIQEAIASMGETPRASSPQSLAAQLAGLIVAGRLKIRKSLPINDRFSRGAGGARLGAWLPRASTPKVQQQTPTTPTTPATDWIKVRVVDDTSGRTIAKVVLDLKTPNGNTEQHATRLSGEIESLGIESGTCDVSSDFKKATLANTLAFVGVGENPIGQHDGSDTSSEPAAIPQSESQLFIAAIEEHKVRTGETMKSLAETAGMSKEQLAQFNWGTEDPKEVNDHLARDVGCTTKSDDGESYQFDDADNPGIVYIPRSWSKSGLSTNQFHVVRVRYLSYQPQDNLKTVNLLEFEDAFFRTKSAVLLPEHQEVPTEGASTDTPSTTGLVASCLRYCAEHPEVKALVTGHADTTGSDQYNIPLSKYRAQSVYAAIVGDRDTFVEACDGPHLTSKQEKLEVTRKDRIQILDWVSMNFGWPCGFAQNNSDYFRAVSSFQRSYNQNGRAGNESGEDLAVDGDWGKKTWGGVFDCYESHLASSLGVDRAGLANYRSKVHCVDENTPYTGCGEYHPIDNLGADNYRSQINRRVEVLFFDPGDEPALECFQGGCAEKDCLLYDLANYERIHLPAGGVAPKKDATIKVATLIEFEDVLFRTDRAVVMPSGEAPATDPATGRIRTMVGAAAAVLRHCEEHSDQKVLVSGHTDTTGSPDINVKLSVHRANCVTAVLTGEADTFATICGTWERMCVADYQQILKWVADTRGWDCDPGPINNQHNAQTNRALTNFRKLYNEVGPGSTWAPKCNQWGEAVDHSTWVAYFNCYEEALAAELGTDLAGVAALRAKLVWLISKRATGCGESHPKEAENIDEYRSQTNRRVEVLFFAPGNEPGPLTCDPDVAGCQAPVCEIYDRAKFRRTILPPMLSAKPWTASWQDASEPTGIDDPPRKMLLEAPELPAAQEISFEVIQEVDGIPITPAVTITSLSAAGSAEAEFEDWFDQQRVTKQVQLSAGGRFPEVRFRFIATGGGRRIPAMIPLGYNDLLYVRYRFKDTNEPIANTKYTLYSPWGTLEDATDAQGCVRVENIPPGGADVIVHHPDLAVREV